MIGMGRPKTAHKDLPQRMVARVLAHGKRLFYYKVGKRKIPLGSDLNAARVKWAELESVPNPNGLLFPKVAEQYAASEIPKLRRSTQREYERAVKNLSVSFAKFSLEQIKPGHVQDYIERRSRKIAAIREKSVLSAVFIWARKTSLTDAPNPCDGMGFSKQQRAHFEFTGKRERYVTDAEYQATWDAADDRTRDVMDLLLLTGQRLGDVLKWTRQNVQEGVLRLKQNKTGTWVGIRVEGQLKAVLERIQARPRAVATMFLVADEKGQKLTQARVYYGFVKAKGDADWQMRDLRAKAATDSPDLATASKLLGHTTEQTTAQIYRRSKSSTVGPLK